MVWQLPKWLLYICILLCECLQEFRIQGRSSTTAEGPCLSQINRTCDANTGLSSCDHSQDHHAFDFYWLFSMNNATDIDYSPAEEGWAEGSNRTEPFPLRPRWLHLTARSHQSHFYVFLSLIHISSWSESGNTSPNPHTHKWRQQKGHSDNQYTPLLAWFCFSASN